MRTSVTQLVKELDRKLKAVIEDKDSREVLFTVELMLTVFQSIAPERRAREAWSIIPGYEDGVLPATDLTWVRRIRFLFPHLRNRRGWYELLEQYVLIDKDYRCFDIDQSGTYRSVEPSVVKERIRVYQQIVDNPIPKQDRSLPIAQKGEFSFYYFPEKNLRYGKIPDTEIPQPQLFPDYRPKSRVSVADDAEWLAIAKEMDQRLGDGQRWQRAVQYLRLEPVQQDGQSLIYDGCQHIAGGLGAGKSTFMVMETYRLVTRKGMKIGYIENSVEQAYQRQTELHKLGLKASVVTGPSGRQEHLKRYMTARKNQVEAFDEWQDEGFEALRDLSGVCFIHALAGIESPEPFYPCERLKQEKQRKLCPYAELCGIHAPLRRMQEADVWIVTTASLLYTRLPLALDPHSRLLFEAMYDLLDVIFIDEADKVQQDFDQAFVSEVDLMGAEHHLFEQMTAVSQSHLARNYGHIGHSLVAQWQFHLDHANTYIHKLFRLLNQSKPLDRFLRNGIFHPYRLLHDVTAHLLPPTTIKEESKVYHWLKKHIEDPYDQSPLTSQTNRLSSPTLTQNQREEILKEIIANLDGQHPLPEEQALIYDKLEFLLFLARIDYSLRQVINHYPQVSTLVGFDQEREPVFNRIDTEIKAVLKDSMTGMMLGYRYLVTDGQPLGRFKLVEYQGIGRLLLQDWSMIYEQSDNKAGPAVVLLSGTSYAPGSAHFHVSVPVSWILKREEIAPKVDLIVHPVYDELQGGTPISISGIPPGDQREAQLRKMVKCLLPDIEDELHYWREHWPKPRRVLTVTNSYADARIVGQALEHDPQWRGRFKVLSRNDAEEDFYFAKALIEEFSISEADMLIVPLMAVGRGYNILMPDTGESLFGSVFFLTRPYPVPGDFHYLIQLLHAQLPHFIRTIKKKGYQYERAIQELRRLSIAALENMVKKPDFWDLLSKEEKEVLAWYTMVMMWQMVGRLLRKGTPARVFLCDYKFHPISPFEDGSPHRAQKTLLEIWAEIIKKNRNDSAFVTLYHPWSDAILNTFEQEVRP